MNEEVTKVKGTNVVSFDSQEVDCFGDEARNKYNNAIIRMQGEVLASPGVRGKLISIGRVATLYAVAYCAAGGRGTTDAVTHVRKDGIWNFVTLRSRFLRGFVAKYTKSVWGFQEKSGEEVAKLLFQFLCEGAPYVQFFDPYVVCCASGGIILVKNGKDDFHTYVDFLPYENIHDKEIMDFYPQVLDAYRHGINGRWAEGGGPRDRLMEVMGLYPVKNDEAGGFEREEY